MKPLDSHRAALPVFDVADFSDDDWDTCSTPLLLSPAVRPTHVLSSPLVSPQPIDSTSEKDQGSSVTLHVPVSFSNALSTFVQTLVRHRESPDGLSTEVAREQLLAARDAATAGLLRLAIGMSESDMAVEELAALRRAPDVEQIEPTMGEKLQVSSGGSPPADTTPPQASIDWPATISSILARLSALEYTQTAVQVAEESPPSIRSPFPALEANATTPADQFPRRKAVNFKWNTRRCVLRENAWQVL